MIYLFNNNEEMIRIVPNSAIKRMYQTQTLTDENYISDRLDVEIQALNDEELSELEYMAVDDIENPQRFHYYFIVKETTERQVTSLTGVQSGIEELRKTPVYDMRPTNLSPKLIADRLLEGTNWQTGYTTDDVGTISTNFYYTDVFSALKKMCMAFGIEMQFFVEITTNRIGARYIEFRKRTGKSVGKRVVYGHNALKIVKEVEKTNTVTALIGRGKGVQVSESDAGNVGYGRKIGIENVEWKTSSGAPVDKPLGQEFVEIPELTLQYGIKNSNGTVRPKIGFVEFQDEESETRLIDRTYNALLELSRPQVLLETSSVYLPDTGIGDTINVVRHDRDLRYQTRVFEITWDRLANQAVDMKLGDRLGESENKRISRISNQVSGNISTELGSTIDELVDRLTTADGKNTNWYTDYDPMANPETMGLVRVNDNWYQPDPEYEGEFILKQWNGEMWIEILRTSGNQELVRRFEEIEQQAEELTKDIEASDQKATEAKEEAGLAKSAVDAFGIITQETAGKMVDVEQIVATADSNATDALAKAREAETQAGQAVTEASEAKSQSGQAVFDAQTAMDNAREAQADSKTAIDNSSLAQADASKAQSDAKTAIDNASKAQTDAKTAIGNAKTAQTDAQTAIENAQTALSTAGNADSKAGQAIAKANAIPTTVSDIIADKNLVNGSYVDTKVDDATGAWSQELVRVEGKIPTEIGGRNLVLNTQGEHEPRIDGSAVYILPLTESGDFLGKELTLSFKAKSSNGSNMVYISIGTGGETRNQITGNIVIPKEYTEFKYTFTAHTAVDTTKLMIVAGTRWHPNNEGSVTVTDIKLEKGSIATDWTPAPEDFYSQEEFKLFNAKYTQDVNGMTGRLTTVENTKLDDSTFQTFKQAEYQVTADKVASTMARVDTAEGKITTQGTAISQQANAIASKADKSVVDTLSGTVSNQGTLITQNATDIASKANTATVNTLTGRVDTAESSISQNATAISQRVTTTTYNTGLGTKENSVLKQSTAPAHLNGRLWLDTSVTPNVLKRSTGTTWVKATPTTASEVGAYSSGQGSALAGRVTTAETNITQTSEAITSKADKSVVDTLSGTVSTHGTTIEQQATAISSKAEQSEVDTVKGTVSTHTSTLSQHAKDISARLTQSQVNSLVSDKGYSTVSYVDNHMSATAEGIRAEMTAIEGKIPTYIGGRNYLINTHEEYINDNSINSIKLWDITDAEELRGKVVTFSFELKSSSASNGFYASVSQRTPSTIFEIIREATSPTEYKKYEITFEFPMDEKSANIMIVSRIVNFPKNTGLTTFRKLKLEKGSVATDWSPAPEEMMEQGDFDTFKAEYEQSAKGWSSKLLEIEQADYASRTWSNQTFATPQSVSTQLASYAKTTDLNGLVTETSLTNKNYITSGAVNTLLGGYAKTTALNGMVTETTLANKNFATASSVNTLLTSYAKTTDLNGLATESYVGNQMTATAKAIRTEMTAVENKIPTHIGGRNLVLNTQDEHVTEIAGGSLYRPRLSKSGDFLGKELTLSFKAKSSNGTNKMYVSLGVGGGTIDRIAYDITIPKEYTDFKYTFTSSPNDRINELLIVTGTTWHPNNSGSIAVKDIKLETGNVATDWTPAPEDMLQQSDFNSFKATYEQSAKGWNAKLLEVEQAGYATQTWSNQTFATPQSVNTQLSSYAKSTDLNGLVTETSLANKSYITSSAVNTLLTSYAKTTALNGLATESYVGTQINTTAKGIRTEITAVEGLIEGLEIGGRNLVKDSGVERKLKPSVVNNISYALAKDIDYLNGEEVTVSFEAKSDVNGTVVEVYPRKNAQYAGFTILKTFPLTTDYKRYSYTWTYDFDRTYRAENLFFRTSQTNDIDIREVQIEKGNKATDWTPAPEDMMNQSDFNTFKAEYDQSASGWSSKLLQIEQANYATRTWSNQTFATPQSVSTQLQSYAKTTALNGMVTETTLANKNFITASSVNTLLSSYAKTTALNGMVTETTLANKNFATASSVTTQLQSYAKTTDLNGLATESYVGSQLSATAGTIRSEITAVENKIPTEIGGRNLVLDTQGGREYGLPASSVNRIPLTENVDFLGKELTFSFKAKSSNGTNRMYISLGDGSSTKTMITGNITIPKEYKEYKYTFTASTAVDTTQLMIVMGTTWHPNNSGSITVTDIKLETGKIATDWSPAPEDMATTKQVSSIKQTADAIQALVGTTNDSVASAVMTSNLWETEVSKVIDSELEQEYETVLAPVNVVNEEEHNKGETFSLGKYFYYNGVDRDTDKYLQSGVKHVLEITMPATQNKGQSVSLRVKDVGDTSWRLIGANFNLPTGQYKIVHEFTSLLSTTRFADYRLTVTDGENSPVNTIYSFKIYRNEEVQVPIEDGNTGAISSKITQLYDMINLSVLGKEGAMSRIAMGEEGIQIDGKLLHITAKTFIDDAVIKSAMIDNLDAGKITTGELNASLIKVVNLDANSITGNEASFIKALFSGTISTLQITSNGVSILDNSGKSSTYLDSSGIEFSRSGISLGKLEYVTNEADSGDLNNMHGFSMRPNRNSYFGVSYFPSVNATSSIRRFAVSGRTGNVYIAGLIKPSEQQIYGIDITWGNITGRGTNVRIMNHNRTGGIQINNGDISYLSTGGWRSLNDWIK